MIRVGLTGGLATGKSTVLGLFAKEGAAAVDADALAREIAQPYQEAWWGLYDYLGRDYFLKDMSLDRASLKKLIFNSPKVREVINGIFHPKIKEIIEKDLQKLQREGKFGVAVIDVPLLFEVGWQAFFDKTILVYARPELQIQRLMKRDKINHNRAETWLAAQMPIEEKKNLADVSIDNSGTVEDLAVQVRALMRLFKSQASSLHARRLSDNTVLRRFCHRK